MYMQIVPTVSELIDELILGQTNVRFTLIPTMLEHYLVLQSIFCASVNAL